MPRKNLSVVPLIAPYAIGTGLLIGGIAFTGKKEQCEITNTYHVHLFTKDVGNATINKWVQRENNTSFTKKDDFLPATAFDLEAFDKLDYYALFSGKDNLAFINQQIKRNRDYLKFYYYYEETYTEEDEDGNTVEKTVEYEGWTTNPYHRGVTGKTRVYHTRYFAYKLVYKDGKLELEKSKNVDDVREILDEYPYISENTTHEVCETVRFFKYELPYIDPEELDIFYTPTVENNPLSNEKPQQLKKTK